ncbi:type II toxin-antitoxin system HicB family antitoxin [Dongia deserti]|uniref:type II toxin-antitoxin system HicB family antitoxin n=1 Tax=Dongia deserti TaxID=2268030 RepID=UPI0013C429F2|nr:type II toxin-antitoxin system HicB family antitoxin [Dongia deserti]
MPITVKPLLFKSPRLRGLSERLLASHYENNYGGALRRLNAIDAKLAALDWDQAPVFDINGLKHEQLIAANSVILHEVYFDGLGGDGGDPAGALAQHLERDFGSVAAWKREFAAMGKALAGGSGWVLLTWSARLGRLVNQWAAGPGQAALVELVKILARHAAREQFDRINVEDVVASKRTKAPRKRSTSAKRLRPAEEHDAPEEPTASNWYVAVLFPEALRGWSVLFPDLPGCQTQEETIEEARRMAAEVPVGHIASIRAHGEPVPTPRTLEEIRADPTWAGRHDLDWSEVVISLVKA